VSGVSLELQDDALRELDERTRTIVREELERLTAERGEPYMDVASVARYLSCQPQRIYELTHAKRLPFYKDGKRLLFRRAELDAYLAGDGAA
jgi:excisionase family DNA binding protein